MRPGSVVVLIGSGLLAVITVAVIHVLANLEPATLDPSVTETHLLAGEAWRLFVAPRTWQLVPTALTATALSDLAPPRALATAALLAAAAFGLWRWHRRRDFARAGVLCLAASLALFAVGCGVLANGYAPEVVGSCFAWMLGTLLWSACAAAVFAAGEIWLSRRTLTRHLEPA